MKHTRTFLTLALSAAGILGSTSIANAGLLQLQVTRTGGPTITAIDNTVNDDDPTLNSIKILEGTWIGTFAELGSGTSFEANSNQDDALATFSQLTMDSNITLVTGSLLQYTILASQTDFTKPLANAKVTQSTGDNTFVNNAPTATTDYIGWVGTNNVLNTFGPVTPGLHGTWSTTGGPLPTSDPDEPVLGPLFFTDASPFALTGRVRTTLSAGAQVTAGGSIAVAASAIPEPASMGLFGMGLAALYFVSRKK